MEDLERINLNFAWVEEKLHIGVRRVAAFMAIGVNAARTANAEALKLDHRETNISFYPEMVEPERVEEAAREFRHWVQTNGLRELCAFLEQYLGDLYLCAAWVQLSENGRVHAGANPQLPKDFTFKGVSIKLNYLESTFGVTAPHANFLSTFWDARNCLTHRLGFVGQTDFTDGGDALLVKWMGLESWLCLDGQEPVLMPLDLGEGMHTLNGGHVKVVTVERVKAFRLNERIFFDAHELSEILLTAQTQCQSLMRGVIALAQAKGLVPADYFDNAEAPPEQLGEAI